MGSDYAGVVCDYSINSDVTVKKGGTVGGVLFNLSALSPEEGSLTVETGGKIEAADIGVEVLATTSPVMLGSISNKGSIIAAKTGISIDSNTTVVGSIMNSGVIIAGDVGVSVTQDASTGKIMNSGFIIADVGISNFIGDADGISNSGSIIAGSYGIYIGQATLDSEINNSGLISASGTAIGIYSGLGSSTVTGGITNSGTIQGGVKAIYVDEFDANVETLDIVGKLARIIGDVDAIHTVVNITSSSVFTSEGDFDVQDFNIASNAVFHMANPIKTGTVDNAGILSIASGTKETITGHYTQKPTGILQIGVQNKATYGQLIVSDTADLSANSVIDIQMHLASSFMPEDVMVDVLKANNSLLPPIKGHTVTDNSFLWQFTAATNGFKGVDLTIHSNPAAYSACQGTYCAGAASAIVGQVFSGNASFGPFATLPTEADFCESASQSSPELINENIQVTQLATRSVIDVLPMWSSVRGQSTGDAMLYEPGKVWVKPYGATMTQNQRTSVNGYEATAYGIVAGRDIAFRDDLMLGAALAIGSDKVHGKSVLSGQSIESDEYQGVAYATKWLPNHTYLAGQGLVGFGDNDSKRVIPLFASTARGSYNSWFTNWSAELGRSYAVNERLLFTPALNASYLYINQNGFNESGSPMDLRVKSNNNDSLLLGADANAAYHVATLKAQQDLTLTAHAGVAYDVLNNQASTIATFVAGGPSFSTYGIQYNDAVFRGGIGMRLTNPTGPLATNLNYDLQAGNNGYNGIFSVMVRYKV